MISLSHWVNMAGTKKKVFCLLLLTIVNGACYTNDAKDGFFIAKTNTIDTLVVFETVTASYELACASSCLERPVCRCFIHDKETNICQLLLRNRDANGFSLIHFMDGGNKTARCRMETVEGVSNLRTTPLFLLHNPK